VGVPLPWITAKGRLDHLRATVKEIVRAAKLATISPLPRFVTVDLPRQRTLI